MILVRAPYRISLFGGGTDYPQFINKHGRGLVIGCAIDKYSYVSVKKIPNIFPYKYRLCYSKIEEVDSIDQIQHNGILTALVHLGLGVQNLEINHTSDLPARMGLGTSSAFMTSLVAALEPKFLNNLRLLAKTSQKMESYYSLIGYQDSAFATLGGCKSICWYKNDIMHWQDEPILQSMIGQNGLLFYLGYGRKDASDIVKSYISRIDKSKYQEDILIIAENIFRELGNGTLDLDVLSSYLEDSWFAKRSISPNISSRKIDEIYDLFKKNGALSGKLCGAGQSGCMFFLAKPENHDKLIELARQNGLYHIPFKIDEEGCKRIL